MELKSNISNVIEKLERIKVSLGGGNGNPPAITDFSDAMFSALNSGNGFLKQRIFNNGEDAEGNKFGKYVGNKNTVRKRKIKKYGDNNKNRLRKTLNESEGSELTPYEQYRVSHGRQVEYKDLEVDGALRRSIETVKVDNAKVVIAITNTETAAIAGYQEQQIGKIRGSAPAKIFILSESEFERVKAEGNEAIRQVVKKLFK